MGGGLDPEETYASAGPTPAGLEWRTVLLWGNITNHCAADLSHQWTPQMVAASRDANATKIKGLSQILAYIQDVKIGLFIEWQHVQHNKFYCQNLKLILTKEYICTFND